MTRVDRMQILAFRLRAGHLERRLARTLLPVASPTGLQDSAPRSAVLSLHARVDAVPANAWKDHRFSQVWGPRGAIRVVPAADAAVFTAGLLPRPRDEADEIAALAERAAAVLGDRRLTGTDLLDALPDLTVSDVRRASRSGRLRVRWDGVDTLVWAVDAPSREPEDLRLDLARRYLSAHGPSGSAEFAAWAGVSAGDAKATFAALGDERARVTTPAGARWMLERDLPALAADGPVLGVRLLPPGDPHLENPDRATTVPDGTRHATVWARSVPPGALLVDGEIAGTWRRRGSRMTIAAWEPPAAAVRAAAEHEAETMPLPFHRTVTVEWTAA